MVFEDFCPDEFWNWTKTWHPSDSTAPDFTLCFEQTALTWFPCAFLLLLAPIDIYFTVQSGRRGNGPIPWRSSFAISKLLLNSALISLQLQLLAWYLSTDEDVYDSQIFAVILRTAMFILIAFMINWSRLKGVCSSGIQFMFWFFLVVSEAFAFRTTILHADTIPMYPFIIELIFYPITICQLLLCCWADVPAEKLHRQKVEGLKKPCPEQYASFLSKVVFFWFEGLGWKGYRRPLENADLWNLNPEDKSEAWYPRFDKEWEKALLKKKKSGTQNTEISILPTMIRVFGPSFAFGAFMKLIHDLLIFVSPEILGLLITHVASDDPAWKGYVYTFLLFGSAVLQTLALGQYFHQMFLIGMRIRSTLVSVIYRKALVMSNTSRKESTVGEIVNLMSVDAQRFMDMMPYLNMLWSAPLQIALCLYFLWERTLGPSVLAGVAVMILLIPLNGVIVSKVRTLQMMQMKNKDSRVKLMSEILSGIKVLKLYAWEPSFETQVLNIRGKEYKVLKKSAYLFAGVAFIWTCTPFLVSVVTFATYVLSDTNNVLDAQKAFVSTTLFNIMRSPLSMLPMVITGLVQASVSLKRLNKFMNSEDINPSSITHLPNAENPVEMESATFAWETEPILKNINMKIKEGSLTAVVGAVGSGKSTLLAAILGELEKLNGKVNTKGSIAYVAQLAWIQNDTLRNNILFGKNLDFSKYDAVIESCALKPDLDILTAGDQTEIGEKGINLSGGQKQRVSLARAAYNNADIYLLDDPLSAVDSHVGKHIFENVIGPKGLLNKKTRVLVTHGITFLPETDHIIVLKDGEISEEGTYKALLKKKGAFAEFLIQHLGSEEEDAIEEASAIIRDLEDALGPGNLARQISRISETDGLMSDDKVAGSLERQLSIVSAISKGSVRGRKGSKVSLSGSIKKKPDIAKEKLIQAEKVETGSVKMSVYMYYMKSIGWNLAIWTLALHLLNQGLSVYSNIWLTEWSSEPVNGTLSESKRNMYLGVYGALGLGQALSVLVGSLTIALGTLYASQFLHLSMLERVFKSPMSFFDTTPTGRIVNRFAKDVDTCDNVLPHNLRSLLTTFLGVISTIGVISYSTPIFMSVIIPIGIIYYLVQRFYVATSRQLKRLESTSRSPIYSHFGETLTGTTTIRAFGMQQNFIQSSEDKVDFNQTNYFPSIVSNRWLAVRLETVGNFLILFSALFAVMNSDDPGLAGLSISYALQITQTLNWMVRMTSDVETNIVAVERIKEYCEISQEADWEIPDRKPPKTWPEQGVVRFEKYQTRYREGMDLVLRDVTCNIESAEKVGIVGRTGAGKSSLTLGLFRIIEAAGGHIEIDGQNISKLGLHDVRGKITIIPQDPVLFSGTLRINLDPFGRYSDDELWHALEHAHLKTFVQSVASGLEYEVNEGGENLSVGQRQLICLARALLRKTKILVLDEATAAIDLETDDLIQQTIRSEFKDCTVLTIAHRLNTIMDSTRVMVLDKGEIREFDTPAALLSDSNSIFYGMAKDAGLV